MQRAAETPSAKTNTLMRYPSSDIPRARISMSDRRKEAEGEKARGEEEEEGVEGA